MYMVLRVTTMLLPLRRKFKNTTVLDLYPSLYIVNIERLCIDYYRFTWCCLRNEPCGTYSIQCSSDRTTKKPFSTYSSTMPTSLIVLLIVMLIFFIGLCLSCCISSKRKQQQRTRASIPTRNRPRIIHQHQQQPSQTVRIPPAYNINTAPAPSIHEESPPSFARIPSLYEEPPPSYEVAIAGLSLKYQSEQPPPPPVTASVEIESTRL
ncbi:unnamed protein product [Rotaria sordida]|uniref:T cell CD4 receptor C-terminal region domain-containing protein n=1 Tax=Rotaria sordida TaxID=392033 RepID=A0A814LDR6_9BILA|nr:unnamed protein product [Rotaria sordida]